MALLEVRNLSAGYGEVRVLHRVTLAVSAGSIVALVGANGAGKTTLLNTISGLIRRTEGEVVFDGRDMATIAPDAIVRAGLVHVPEGRKLFQGMTVLENLLVGGATSPSLAERSKRLDFVSELFPKLRARRSQLAGTMSGGEQQMVAIARGLMSGPRLLLLDEVSLGLAPVVIDEIFEAITELVASYGLTIMLVEQNTELALRATSYAYVLENGQVALEGHSSNLLCDDRVRKAYLGI